MTVVMIHCASLRHFSPVLANPFGAGLVTRRGAVQVSMEEVSEPKVPKDLSTTHIVNHNVSHNGAHKSHTHNIPFPKRGVSSNVMSSGRSEEPSLLVVSSSVDLIGPSEESGTESFSLTSDLCSFFSVSSTKICRWNRSSHNQHTLRVQCDV